MADIIAGALGGVLGVISGCFLQLLAARRREGAATQVLFVDQTGRLGGAELMLLDIASARSADSEVVLFQDGEFRTALEAEGVKTRVFTLSDEAAAVGKQAGVWRALRTAPGLMDVVLRLARAARAFDVVYANTAKALIIGGPAARLAGRPLIFHLHDIISGGHFSALNRRALVFCANHFASAVIANSGATQAAFIASGGRAGRCVIIPNGFRIPEQRTSKEAVMALKESLGIAPEAWTVLMAGRLTPWKGQHVLLEALASMPEAHAVLLGDALFTAEDHEYAQELRRLAAGPDLAGRVHFAGFRSHTAAFFDMADVVVHASVIAEPFGRVIVEGMLAGKPVIATRAGGAAEIITHEQTGLLVEPGQAGALAEALRRLNNQPDFAAELAQGAEAAARGAYALKTVRMKIENVIRSTTRREASAVPAALTVTQASPIL